MQFLKDLYKKMIKTGILSFIPDKPYLEMSYFIRTGRKLNLKNPKRYCEKMQWTKLYDRRPEYTNMVCKYEAKKHIANIVGDEYIIPTLGVWDSFDEIDFDKLPDSFVLKCTHDSGGLVICKDKSKLDMEEARKKITKSLKTNYYTVAREWPYKNVKKRIIAEEIIEDVETGYLKDYKFFCFDGEVKCLYVTSNRGLPGGLRMDYFDTDWNHLPINHYKYPHNDIDRPKKPENFDKMLEIAKELSKGIPHVRVDLYNISGKIYVGELTLFIDGGFREMTPDKYNEIFGDWIKLPKED